MIIIRGPNNQCGLPAKRPHVSLLLFNHLFFLLPPSPSLSPISCSSVYTWIYTWIYNGICNEMFCYDDVNDTDVSALDPLLEYEGLDVNTMFPSNLIMSTSN